jgi:hypothetical protein
VPPGRPGGGPRRESAGRPGPAVAAIDELVPPTDAELDGQRMEELAGRLATVRPFLPLLMETVEFGATGDGVAVLAAMRTLATLLTVKP